MEALSPEQMHAQVLYIMPLLLRIALLQLPSHDLAANRKQLFSPQDDPETFVETSDGFGTCLQLFSPPDDPEAFRMASVETSDGFATYRG